MTRSWWRYIGSLLIAAQWLWALHATTTPPLYCWTSTGRPHPHHLQPFSASGLNLERGNPPQPQGLCGWYTYLYLPGENRCELTGQGYTPSGRCTGVLWVVRINRSELCSLWKVHQCIMGDENEQVRATLPLEGAPVFYGWTVPCSSQGHVKSQLSELKGRKPGEEFYPGFALETGICSLAHHWVCAVCLSGWHCNVLWPIIESALSVCQADIVIFSGPSLSLRCVLVRLTL